MRTFSYVLSAALLLLSVYYQRATPPPALLPPGAEWSDHPLPLVHTRCISPAK